MPDAQSRDLRVDEGNPKQLSWRGLFILPSHRAVSPRRRVPPTCTKCPVLLNYGTDPYHNTGQAMGLSFSVPKGTPVPSSLQNIYKELNADLGCTRPSHGCLLKVRLPPASLLPCNPS